MQYYDLRLVWLCPVCNMKYSTKVIEQQLLDLIQAHSMALVLQDLQCEKCLQVRNYKLIFCLFNSSQN